MAAWVKSLIPSVRKVSGVYISGTGIVAGCQRFGDSVPGNYNNHKIYESQHVISNNVAF